MNPEIRFRVHEDIYRLADTRAHEIGLAGTDAGKSAGVPLLARAALYQYLGLPWPDDLPQPTQSPPPAAPASPGVAFAVYHTVDSEFRRLRALAGHRPGPEQTTTRFTFAQVPEEIQAYVKLDPEGKLSGELHVPDLISARETLTEQELLDYARKHLRAKHRAQNWRPMLKKWALEHGGELLRARIEEGFDWTSLAELEWASWKVRSLVGPAVPLEQLQSKESLAGPGWVHSVYRDREPGLERIQLLRELRAGAEAMTDLNVRLSLVKGNKQQLESRKRTSGPLFEAVLWLLDTPGGQQIGLLSHQS